MNSEIQTQEEQLKQPEGQSTTNDVRTLVVQNSAGTGTRTVAVDSKGRFVSQKKKLAQSEKNTGKLRKLLTKSRLNLKGKSLNEAVAEHLMETALECEPEDVGSAAKAFEIVNNRAFGRAPMSDQEQDALTKSGVTFVIVPRPDLMHPEVMDGDAPRQIPTAPSFVVKENQQRVIEGEYVEEGIEK